MTLNEDIVELVDLAVVVDVTARNLLVGEREGIHAAALNEDIIELVDFTVGIKVAVKIHEIAVIRCRNNRC